MRKQFIIGTLLLLTTELFGQSKKDLLRGDWIQFGFKSNNKKEIRILTEDCSKKKAEFKMDGTYFEDMFA